MGELLCGRARTRQNNLVFYSSKSEHNTSKSGYEPGILEKFIVFFYMRDPLCVLAVTSETF